MPMPQLGERDGFTSPVAWLPALKARNFPAADGGKFNRASAMIERAEFPVQRNSTLKASIGLTYRDPVTVR